MTLALLVFVLAIGCGMSAGEEQLACQVLITKPCNGRNTISLQCPAKKAECPVGYKPAKQFNACVSCSAGNFRNGTGDLDCFPCPAGSFASNVGSTGCSECPAGSFASQPCSTSCTECPAGRFASKAGSTVCSECPAGSFASKAGSTVCSECPAGSSAGKGSAVCTECPAGHFASKAGSTECSGCPQGSYSSSRGSTGCVNCAAGTYTIVRGSVKCHPMRRVGCFKDVLLPRDFEETMGKLDNNTPEVCMSHCRFPNFRFAGVQAGEWCFCGNTFGRYGRVNDSECSMKCSGNSHQTCGNHMINEVYAAMRRFGCYKDDIPRDLDKLMEKLDINTPDVCVSHCLSRGYRFAGVQAGEWCLCGNTFGRYGRVDDSECSMKCSGNSNQTCGNSMINEVYSNYWTTKS